MPPGFLEGRVIAVTGASTGLGAAYAQALVAEGAHVVVNARSEARLRELAESLPGAVAVPGDVADVQTAERIVAAALSAFGRIDAVVNNAGTLADRTLLKMSLAEFDDVMRTHVYGTFIVSQRVAQAMRESGGGTIITVGSDSGMRGAFGQTNYAAAKGAIAAMTLTWAQELPRYGITCNCVLPNALTAMTENLDSVLADYRYGPPEDYPRAIGEAAEAAPLVALLASKRWSRLNGLFLSLGGDKLSIWDRSREIRCAFKEGGWRIDDLDRSLEFALAGDLAAGWDGR